MCKESVMACVYMYMYTIEKWCVCDRESICTFEGVSVCVHGHAQYVYMYVIFCPLHCRGKTFRTDFAHIGEIRSLT